MPNRIIRDWTDSESVNALTANAERLFVRLIMKADDFGRLTGNVKLLRPMMYPLLLDQVRESDLTRWIAECEKAGLVRLYAVGAKHYIEVQNFKQRSRAETSKFPDPPPPTNDRHMTVIGQSNDGPLLTETETETETGAPTGAEVEKTSKGVPIPSDLRTPEFVAAWREWERHLKAKGVRCTDLADQKQLAKCSEWGVNNAIRNIHHSIASNYQGLFPVKQQENGHRPVNKPLAAARVFDPEG